MTNFVKYPFLLYKNESDIAEYFATLFLVSSTFIYYLSVPLHFSYYKYEFEKNDKLFSRKLAYVKYILMSYHPRYKYPHHLANDD